MLKKRYKVLGLIGIIIWVGVTLLRDTSIMNHQIVQRLLWVAPNFGSVWVAIFLIIISYPKLTKKDFKPKYVYYITTIVFLLTIASELIHSLFLNASFDIWDITASLIASIIFLITHKLSPSE